MTALSYTSMLGSHIDNMEIRLRSEIMNIRGDIDRMFPPAEMKPWLKLELELEDVKQENLELKERLDKLEFLLQEN